MQNARLVRVLSRGSSKAPLQRAAASCLASPVVARLFSSKAPSQGKGDPRGPLLFTPGPLLTSRTVKEAMLRDLGSRDHKFIGAVREVREKLLELAAVPRDEFTSVIVQGSGTFGVESTLGSVVPGPNGGKGKLMVIANGAYGERMCKIAQTLGIPHFKVTCPEDRAPDPRTVDDALRAQRGDITTVAIVHSETTSGVINPIEDIGRVVRQHGATYIVDAMSSFGAVPIDFQRGNIDFLVSSANKCIEGVPGFSFCIMRRSKLKEAENNARSLALDLHAQWKGLETNGQFRFTPPTHAILAFRQALAEIEQEGGVEARGARYRRNRDVLVEGMTRMGFEMYITDPSIRGYIITSFHYPKHPKWDFARFYDLLNRRNFVIYPGKVSNADCFRIGHIGQIFEEDTRGLLRAIQEVLQEMGVELRGKAA